MKTIVYSAEATRELRSLPINIRDSLIKKLHHYAATGAGKVKDMKGHEGSRLRLGSFRIIFVETDTTIEVRAAGHRSNVYK